ncbi:MAG: hypothetical protein GXX89_04895 [Clostridiales bacterium]|jgi:hypothetical protein|nr:hypothetical protein [Clostridiales bacterium]
MSRTRHKTRSNKSNTGAKRQKEADIIANKIMAAFSVAFIGTLGIMFLRNRVASQGPDTMLGLRILMVFGALVFLAGIFLYYRQKRRQDPDKAYWFAFLSVSGLAACVCAALLYFVGYQISGFLSIILPIAAIYYFLHTVFVREGFVSLILCGLSAALYWYSSRYLVPMSATWVILYAVLFLINAAVFAAALIEKSGRTALRVGGKPFKLLSPSGSHIWLYITLALLTVMLLASFFLGAAVAYVLMYVSIAYFLICVIGMMVKIQ